MPDHEHDWFPTEGERAQYHCVCGATGYKNWYTGETIAHKKPKPPRPALTAREAVGKNRTGHKLPASSSGRGDE
jgi:hypothetical protein